MLCGEASLVNHGEQAIRAVTLFCRCWSCNLCLPVRKARLVNDVAAGLPTKLLTLTTRVVAGGDAVAEARRFTVCFAQLIRRIKKLPGCRNVAYFVVREATKQGWPHIHVALRSPYIPWPWLTAQWLEISGSPGADIRPIYGAGNAAKYLAKYIGKDPHRFGTTKRYWHSDNWFDVVPPQKRPDTGWNSRWYLVREHVGKLAEHAWMRGWQVTMMGTSSYFEARAPPCEL